MTTRIDIVVFDGVDELDALGPLEVLRGAADAGADLAVRLVTRTRPLEVTGAHRLTFQADAVYEPGGADVLIVPGGGWISRSERGAWAEAERGDWLPLLRAAADSGTVMASVCTGALLLARAGVIGDRRAITHHGARQELVDAGATVVDERVVDDGDLITAGGVTSGIDLALSLVERFAGADAAEQGADRLEYSWVGPTRAAPAGHPAPAGHHIATEKVEGVVRAIFNGEVIAETSDALLLREATLKPVVYFPMEDVRMSLFSRTELATTCPFKGQASYWSLEVADSTGNWRRSDDIAWAYQDPLPGRSDLLGRIAFYADRLDRIDLPAQ